MTHYFDVTELIGLRFNSGIQRVVREIAGRATARDRPSELVVAIGQRFHRLTPEGRAVMTGRSGAIVPAGPGRDSALKAALRRFPSLFALAQQAKFRKRLKAMRTLYEAKPVLPGAGDTVVLIDSLWSGGSAIVATQAAQQRGAQVALIVHDLIPIHHPALVSREVAHVFPKVMARAIRLADGIVTVSRQVAKDLLAYAPMLDPARITHAYHGHDFFPAAEDAKGVPEPSPPGLWRGNGRTYLMVGTIEPRKGHNYVLDGFERLWAAGGEQTLLVIGKPGWHGDALLARCAGHSQRNKRLFLIHDASDRLLREAIARADALIMASWLEGFGLPLVEALSAGRPVLASDIPVFREIAGDAATFFRCGDAAAVAEAIRRFEADPASALARARGFHWPNWDEAAKGFEAAIETVLAPRSR